MTDKQPSTEFLVISRGQWDEARSQEEIQSAIDAFYDWHDRLVAEGTFRAGQRLAIGGRTVSRQGMTDGPFSESKELIGGFWFVIAGSLDEAASIAARNPCIGCGLAFEIRPLDPQRASAAMVSNETPVARRGG
ncbi:MAG: YciI family protein [Luteimonas sp.]|nr:YciI family protein [Luteimonas sp.]